MPQQGNTIFLYLELWNDKPVKYNSFFFLFFFTINSILWSTLKILSTMTGLQALLLSVPFTVSEHGFP